MKKSQLVACLYGNSEEMTVNCSSLVLSVYGNSEEMTVNCSSLELSVAKWQNKIGLGSQTI